MRIDADKMARILFEFFVLSFLDSLHIFFRILRFVSCRQFMKHRSLATKSQHSSGHISLFHLDLLLRVDACFFSGCLAQ